MRLDVKQLASAAARRGEALVWDGQSWSPDDGLASIIETQNMLIAQLAQALRENGIDLPDELEELADVAA